VKGGSVNRGDSKEEGKVMPERGNKQQSTVKGDGVGKAKAGNPGRAMDLAQEVAEVEERGVASAQQVVRSMMVKM
jgi:hypothetical protein